MDIRYQVYDLFIQKSEISIKGFCFFFLSADRNISLWITSFTCHKNTLNKENVLGELKGTRIRGIFMRKITEEKPHLSPSCKYSDECLSGSKIFIISWCVVFLSSFPLLAKITSCASGHYSWDWSSPHEYRLQLVSVKL